jgi:vancomycin resistance protein YoaR
MLEPGGVFSFNRVVGARLSRRGYRPAPALAGGISLWTEGGGVCQVATTLYNAALRAGLPILERHPHSRVVDYVEPGLDAAVSYAGLDLRFANDLGVRLWLRCELEASRLTAAICSTEAIPVRVSIKLRHLAVAAPPVIYRREAMLPPSRQLVLREGSPGVRVAVVRRICAGPGPPREELISCDEYPPETRVVLVGGG